MILMILFTIHGFFFIIFTVFQLKRKPSNVNWNFNRMILEFKLKRIKHRFSGQFREELNGI